MKRNITLFCLVIVLFISSFSSTPAEEMIDVGELGRFILGGNPITAENLYGDLLRFAWECNDWDLLYALQAWQPNSNVQLLHHADNSNSREYSEQYSFYVEVEDEFVHNEYTVSFDCWVNREYEEGEYYNCNIDLISSEVRAQDITWISRDTEQCYFELDNRPDGQTALIGHFYWSTSYDPWDTKYSMVSFVPTEDNWNGQPYGYKVSFNDAIQVMLYPDGTLYNNFYKLMFYPEGMEEQIKGMDLTSGNAIGTTSSNLFNGGLYAVEGDVMVYHIGHSVYRSKLDGSDEMCLYSGTELDYIRSLNLINGECYFTCSGEAAYGYDLNGNMLFHVTGDLEKIIADDSTVYYSVFRDTSKGESGLYAYDKSTGSLRKLVNGPVDNIAVDGDWIYLDDHNRNLYRCRKDGSGFEQLYNNMIGPFIAEDGVVLFYDRDSFMLHTVMFNSEGRSISEFNVAHSSEFGGESAYVGSDETKKVAYHNGYLYYYYPNDNSMICRMTLDRSVTEEFVCYTDWAKGGIYFFGNSLYLSSGENLYYKTDL